MYSEISNYIILSCINLKLARLSLSLGGSWGSEAMGFEGGEVGFLAVGGGSEGVLSFTAGAASDSGVCFSALGFSSAGGGWAAAFSAEAAWATPSPDFEITAIFAPGSTVSPSLAISYYQLH